MRRRTMHCKAQAGVGNVDEMDDAQTKKKNKKEEKHAATTYSAL